MQSKLLSILISMILMTAALTVNAQTTLQEIQNDWAIANYQTDKKAQAKAFETLVTKARELVASDLTKAEPKIWLAIVLSTDAGVTGGLGALGKVKEARKFLEEAEKIDASALNGSVYTSLGSLYYQVPGWPIGFGKKSKADEYLKKALSINPDGIDPNYFYGDFLLEEGKYEEAVNYLKKAQSAPARPGRELADQGRQTEVAEKLALAQQKLASGN